MSSQMNGCHVPVRRSHTEPGLQANWRIFSWFIGMAGSVRLRSKRVPRPPVPYRNRQENARGRVKIGAVLLPIANTSDRETEACRECLLGKPSLRRIWPSRPLPPESGHYSFPPPLRPWRRRGPRVHLVEFGILIWSFPPAFARSSPAWARQAWGKRRQKCLEAHYAPLLKG